MTDEQAADYAYDLVEMYIEDKMGGLLHGYGLDVVFPSNPKDVLMVEVVCGSETDADNVARYLGLQANKSGTGIAYVYQEGFVVMVEFDF